MRKNKTAEGSFLVLTGGLAAKLAAIVVHADEMLSADGHPFDRAALLQAVNDADVQDWIKRCGALAPVKRRAP